LEASLALELEKEQEKQLKLIEQLIVAFPVFDLGKSSSCLSPAHTIPTSQA